MTVDEAALIARCKAGDRRAQGELIQRYERFVRSRVWKRRGSRVPLEDLQQEARLGLLRAVETYEPERAAFSTYAHWWVVANLNAYINRNWSLVYSTMPKVGREAFLNGVSSRGGFDRSLNAPLHYGAVEGTHQDLLRDPDWRPLDEALGERQHRARLRADLAGRIATRLNDVERRLIQMRWCVDGEEQPTLEACRREFGGLTRARLQQIEESALCKLGSKEHAARREAHLVIHRAKQKRYQGRKRALQMAAE